MKAVAHKTSITRKKAAKRDCKKHANKYDVSERQTKVKAF